MTILDAKHTRPLEGGASFSIAHRCFRALWTITWFTFASWTPPFFLPWRRLLLRLFGARIANTAVIYSSATIWYPPNIVMDEYACLGPEVMCYSIAPIRLGHHSVVSQGAHLCAGTHDINDADFQLVARPIFIGPFAWIAAEAFVGPGTTVGEGAVLGARAVAFHNLPDWTVHVGNPAKHLKNRQRLAND
jgi:putative colanic acid biosynthesis acetyltransferase WcaF